MSIISRNHAYLAGPDLTEVWKDWRLRQKAYEVEMLAWHGTHPDVPPVAVRTSPFGFDRPVIGFAPNGKRPDGLRQNGSNLWTAYKDARGARWRELLATLPEMPRVDHLLKRFELPRVTVDGPDWTSYICGPQFMIVGEQVFFLMPKEIEPSEFWTPVPMSQYFLALEAVQP